jgi:4-amino-4-deoxy-L-arabinose transferase-like glycosyltransferase
LGSAWRERIARLRPREAARGAGAATRRTALAGARATRRVPLAAWICAAVAVLNAFCWSIITPPFQVPDEPSHFAYVKQLVENHSLPSSDRREFASEESVVFEDLRESPYMPPTGTLSTTAQQRRFVRRLDVAAEEPREGSPAAGVATSQPPLYYALEAIPYAIGYDGNLLTRLTLMRLFSALFAGLTALFVYLFVREALPASRSGAVAAGLGIAFAPLLGFMSGSLNPDSLLFAVSAAAFWALARAFRRGLTYRRAAAIGVIAALGLITKVNFIGLFPGVILGLAVLAVQARRRPEAHAYRLFAVGAGIALSPVFLYAIVNLASSNPTVGLLSGAANLVHGSLLKAVGYTWKLFLPHLPGQKPYTPGLSSTQVIWFDGFVGQYGWLETTFPGWVYELATVIGVAALVACLRTLVVVRRTVRARLAELGVYSVMALGLVLLIGWASYFNAGTGESYTQARYLLPLLALFAAGLGLATRAAGRRWEPVLGTVLVLAMFADNLFSQLLVISRFYG